MSNVALPMLPHSNELAPIQSPVVRRNSNLKNSQCRLMENRALEQLESHPHFRGRGHWITCHYQEGCLYLEGKLPSFYLKQLAQEAIRSIEGIDRIENRIEVNNPCGYDLIEPDARPKQKPR